MLALCRVLPSEFPEHVEDESCSLHADEYQGMKMHYAVSCNQLSIITINYEELTIQISYLEFSSGTASMVSLDSLFG